MNKKLIISIIILFFLIILSISGCMDLITDGTTIYQEHPTKVRYNIQYGYKINCTGSGNYKIYYNCDKPEIILGNVYLVAILYENNYTERSIANNDIISWNISGVGNNNYELGVAATIQAESFLISDLNGENALTIQEIRTQHLDLVNQYCNEQTKDNEVYIDPNNEFIKYTASKVQNETNSENAFIIAKSLFSWLKDKTQYRVHIEDTAVQPLNKTYQLGSGDCDDLSFLYISLCRSLDIPARFIRGYILDEKNGIPTPGPHAWVEVFVGGDLGNNGWIPVECAGSASTSKIEIHQNFGLEDVMHLRLFVDDGSNESINESLSGILLSRSPDSEISSTSFSEITEYTVLESKKLEITKENQRSHQE